MNLSSIWDTISGAAKSVGSTISQGASSVWNTLTQPITSPSTPAQKGLADVASTAGNVVGDVLGLFGLNQKAGGDLPASMGTPTFTSNGSVVGSFATPEQAAAYNAQFAGTPKAPGYQGATATPTYTPPSSSVGGMSFTPAPQKTPSPSAPSGGVAPGTPAAPPGYQYSNGRIVVAPTAPSGGGGTGNRIAGGGTGNTPPPQGTTGNPGGGTSASLGAGSAIQGGSFTGAPADSGTDQKKKATQTIDPGMVQGGKAFIPYSGTNAPDEISKLGLTQAPTPQGGTGYKDSAGNFYTQDASGFHIQTSLPAGSGPTLTQNGQSYALQPAPNISTQLGQGRVFTLTDNQGNVQYFVQTPQGFSPVVGANLNGQMSGQLTGNLGAANSNIQVPQANGNVPVGPQAITVPNTGAPSFDAGGVSNPLDVGSLTTQSAGQVGDIANAVASGAVSPQTLDQFNATLQNQINGIVSSMSSQSGIDPASNYNIDPSLVANGDQTISGAIASDPSGFTALNEQFGVPQLQKQYVGALTSVAGITNAVNQVTQQILSDPNMPKGLAQNQISYLANRANLLMTPFTSQANIIKAQLGYATANMRTYYSNYWKGQTMGMNQLKLALSNNAITPDNAAQWAAATGMDPTSLVAMSSFKTALNLATLDNKEAITQSNQLLTQLASDPASVPNILNGIQSGMLDPSIINSIPSRGGGAVLKLRLIQGAADTGVDIAGAKTSFGFAASTKVKQQVAALQNVQALIPDMIKLSNSAPRSVGAINKYLLPAGAMIGNVHYSNFSEGVTAMADELSGALGFGSATDMSREMGYNLTDPNQTPEQFASAMQTIVKPFIDQKSAALYTQMGQYAPSAGGAPKGAGSSAAPGGAAVNSADPLNLGL